MTIFPESVNRLTKGSAMEEARGTIALMGSGELTATMVEVHKDLMAGLGPSARAVFMDTPAGFQLNADLISEKAVSYFRNRVGREMAVASLKSPDLPPYDVETAAHCLRSADYVLIGPGSPTYAVRVLASTPLPEVIRRRVADGACLVAASAAALTVGRFTLPVYEIYKVGESPHWVDGMNLLERFGLDLAVIPHWNNAEGGTHDTRRCFMGEERFSRLETLLPPETAVLGLDEHSACILDFAAGEARVRGLGRVVLRRGGAVTTYRKGDRIPLDVLRGAVRLPTATLPEAGPSAAPPPPPRDEDAGFWEAVHRIGADFDRGLQRRDPAAATTAILDLDSELWRASRELESDETISQARETLRDMIVMLGHRLEAAAPDPEECLAPFVERAVRLRDRLRRTKRWEAADAIRDLLDETGVTLEDSPEGPRWRVRRGAPPEERKPP